MISQNAAGRGTLCGAADKQTSAVTTPNTRSPTEAEIAAINAHHLIATPLRPADLLFVFGTREDVEVRVDEACRLWREGFFRWAIVSGGVTPGSDLSECEIIADAMVGLLVRALATSEFTGALFLVGMAIWFAWTIGGFIKRNRPRGYSFDQLPGTLLP